MRFVLVLSLSLCCAVLCLGCSIARAQDESAARESATVTVPAAEWEALKVRLEALEKEVQELKAAQAPPSEEAPAPAPPAPAPEAPAPTGGRYLALPDISLIAQAKGHLSSDAQDEGRDSLRVSEVELGVQGWVYPNVKADAFLTASPEEGAPFGVEEAYLTYIGLGSGLNLYVGKKHVAFGRTNLLHSHSWPYVNQPLVLRDLVAEESLLGEGAAVSYLLPTNSSLFAQLDVGTWTASAGHSHEHEGEEDEEGVHGTGAGFNEHFNTARLWASYPVTEESELEAGGSYAEGPAEMASVPGEGRARLTGADLSYRHYGAADSRLLLRGEVLQRREESDVAASTAKGYYLFGNYRRDKYNSLGLLYSWSEFPQAPDLHESALSLIFTKQFSEQYYLRLQGVRGSRPGADPYNELWLQWVWGVGPHTHNLE
jgi:hypothetical protein